MRTRLERIESKGGKLHTTADYEIAREKLRDEPQNLTVTDVAVLDFFGSAREAEMAEAARQKATQPAVAVAPATPQRAMFTDEDHEAIAHVIAECIKAGIEPLKKRLAALEDRQPTPGVEYAGVFSADKRYKAGSLVTKNGSLWLCTCETGLSMAQAPNFWKLIVKEGRA